MALPPLAEVSDLAAWVGRAIPDADPRAGAVLSHASTKVRAYTRNEWMDEAGSVLADPLPDVISQVAVRVAARAYRNPEDLDSVTLDDGTKRWGSIRGLVLTDEDKSDLSEYRSDSLPSGIGTIGTYRDDSAYLETNYVPTGPPPAGYPFPWYADDPLGF